MAKTIGQMTAETREINVEKGWRPAAGGPGANTFGDYLALLHSEASEMLEAFRDWRLDDATKPTSECRVLAGDLSYCHVHYQPVAKCGKPQGVGSELADVLIRLLDSGDVFEIPVFDPDSELADVAPMPIPDRVVTFGDHVTWLHECIAAVPHPSQLTSPKTFVRALPHLLRSVVAVAQRYGIDLDAEYERKQAYNRTRPYQHGGRTLADGPAAR